MNQDTSSRQSNNGCFLRFIENCGGYEMGNNARCRHCQTLAIKVFSVVDRTGLNLDDLLFDYAPETLRAIQGTAGDSLNWLAKRLYEIGNSITEIYTTNTPSKTAQDLLIKIKEQLKVIGKELEEAQSVAEEGIIRAAPGKNT